MDLSWLCIVMLLVLVLVPLSALVVRNKRRVRDLNAAHATYRAALDRLQADPQNAVLEQQTLAAGRVYANLTRHRKGGTVYDEKAVMHDITAATAGAIRPAPAAAPATPLAVETVETRLQTLDALRAKGVITDDEYAERRRAVLGEI